MVLQFLQALLAVFCLLTPEVQREVLYVPLRIGDYLEQKWEEAHPSYHVTKFRPEVGEEEAREQQ
jgi:hypothetical protein